MRYKLCAPRTIQCKECGMEFYFTDRRRKYCSSKCYNKQLKRYRRVSALNYYYKRKEAEGQ